MNLPDSALTSSDAFAAEIRTRIETGKLKEGDRLPSTQEWAKELRIDHRIIQQALAHLAAKGLLERKPRKGTLVRSSNHRPCIFVIMGWSMPREGGFYSNLLADLRREITLRGFRMEFADHAYQMLSSNAEERKTAIASFGELVERAKPVGYIQIDFELNRISDLYLKYRCPSVSHVYAGPKYRVYADGTDFDITGLRYLHEHGRQKVLTIRHHRKVNPSVDLEVFWNEVRRQKFLYAEIREIFDRDDITQSYENYMEAAGYLLMKEIISDWKERRKNYVPDCLLIDDAVAMKGVATALVEAKVSVPENLLIVVKNSTNSRYIYPVPVSFYLVETSNLAKGLLDMLEERLSRRGEIEAPRFILGRMETAEEQSARTNLLAQIR